MSIIYDALKKTEKAINTNSQTGVDTKNERPKSKLKVFLLYGLVVCVGLFIGSIVFGYLSGSKSSLAKLPKASPAVATKPDIAAPVKESPEQPTVSPLKKVISIVSPNIKNKLQESLVLNGVFFSKNEGYALINNRIVKEGDVVEGATVKQINFDGVNLEAEGVSVTLPNK